MEDYITISEFRKNSKVILDAAKNKPVILRRGDELFHLQAIGTIFSSTPAQTLYYEDQTVTIVPKNIAVSDDKVYTATEARGEYNVNVRTSRTHQDILKEITASERERDEKLEYCQDSDEVNIISNDYKSRISALWAEYKELTK